MNRDQFERATYDACDGVGRILEAVYGVRIIHEGTPEDTHYIWNAVEIPMSRLNPLTLAKWLVEHGADPNVDNLVCFLIAHYNLLSPYYKFNSGEPI